MRPFPPPGAAPPAPPTPPPQCGALHISTHGFGGGMARGRGIGGQGAGAGGLDVHGGRNRPAAAPTLTLNAPSSRYLHTPGSGQGEYAEEGGGGQPLRARVPLTPPVRRPYRLPAFQPGRAARGLHRPLGRTTVTWDHWNQEERPPRRRDRGSPTTSSAHYTAAHTADQWSQHHTTSSAPTQPLTRLISGASPSPPALPITQPLTRLISGAHIVTPTRADATVATRAIPHRPQPMGC